MNPNRISPKSRHWADNICHQIEAVAVVYEVWGIWAKAMQEAQHLSDEQFQRRWEGTKADIQAKLLESEKLLFETPLKDPFD